MEKRTPQALTPADLPAPPAGRRGWPWTEGTTPRFSPGAVWPRITVVTPSYNQAEYLEETIRSVLLQGYPNLEYYVVDGGSTDGSEAIIARYSEYLSGWISEPDEGQSHAINKGFAESTGEIHAYLNSDDRYEPGAFFACAESFRQGHEWVVGGVRYWQQGVGFWAFPSLPGRSFTRWLLSCPVGQPGCFWSARLHRLAGPFREDLRYVMDYEMWLRFRFQFGVEPAWIDEPFGMYRLHETSKTVALSGQFVSEITRVVASVEAKLTRAQRARLWAARRHRRASLLGRSGVTHLRDREYGPALRNLGAALLTWPPLALGPAWYLGVKALLGDQQPESPFPAMWPD